jgi:hypothetical protein
MWCESHAGQDIISCTKKMYCFGVHILDHGEECPWNLTEYTIP